MTKLLEESYSKASALPEEEQNRIALAVLQLISTNSTHETSTETINLFNAGKRPGYGCLKGLITVPEDFDATPDDFKDYM